MRLFVAVFPPPEIRRSLNEAAQRLPTDGFRLTAPERIHLTLKFLGDVGAEDLDRTVEALAPLSDGHGPFDVSPEAFGVFPSARRARVLWAGVGEGSEGLGALARDVEGLLEGAGFGHEARPYVPHLTLGRARRPVAFDPGDTRLPGLRFAVREVRLVESRPVEGGVSYSTLAGYPL